MVEGSTASAGQATEEPSQRAPLRCDMRFRFEASRSWRTLVSMWSQTEISTRPRRLRKRTRYFAYEALRLSTSDLKPLLKGELHSARVRWPSMNEAFGVQRHNGALVISGGPSPTEVEVRGVAAGALGMKPSFSCPDCRRTCSHLYLPPGYRTFACRKCRRIRDREHAGPSSIARLREEWIRIGAQIDAVEAAGRRLGEPDVGGHEVDVKSLRRTLRRLEAELRAAAPPGVLEA